MTARVPRSMPRRLAGAARPLCLLAVVAVLACTPTIDAQLDEAQALVAEGRPMAALPLLERVVQREPESGPANLLLGQVLLQAGQTRTAVPPLQRALESERYAVPAGLLLASAHLADGRPRESLTTVDRILAGHPDQPAALRIRATANLQIGANEAALADAQRLLEVAPDDSQAPILLGSALTRLDRLDEAEALLTGLAEAERGAEPTRRTSAACVALASFLEASRRDAPRARAAWDECLEQHPADARVVQGAIQFFDRRGDLARSRAVLESAIERDPAHLGLKLALAERLAAAGRAEEGERLLVEAAEARSAGDGASGGWQTLANFRHRRGDLEGALAALERAIEASRDAERDTLRFQRAMLLLDLGRADAARTARREVDDAALGALLDGRLHLAEGRAEAALEAFERATLLRPGDGRGHYLLGVAAQHLGRIDRAGQAFATAIERDPSATDAALAAARLAQALGDHARAIELVRHHRQVRNTAARDAVLVEVRSLAALGDDEAAAAVLESWLARAPGDVEALSLDAELLGRARGPQAALVRIDQARAQGLDLTDPASRPLLRVFTVQALAAGRPQAARQAIDAAQRKDPEATEPDVLRALMASAAGDTAGAEAALKGAVERAPQDHHAVANYGRWLQGQGRGDEALPLLDRAAALDPSDVEAAYLASNILGARGEHAEAERRLRAIVEAQPLHAGACNDLAWQLAEAGRDLDLALTLARRAVRLNPNGASLDTLGWVQLARGEASEAVDAFEQAVARAPAEPGFRYRLGLALARVGREAEARAAFEKALSLGAFPEAEQARKELARLGPGASAP